MTFQISDRTIDTSQRPYVVAELSANHNGKLDQALKLIHLAKEHGADAVKIQTYRPDTITINSPRSEFQFTSGKWAGQSLYELYEQAHTPWHWHPAIFEEAKAVGITLFSSPFDTSAVDFLEDLNCPAYKIASFELVDLPLIQYAAKTGKPLLMSTGMATETEIEEAVVAAQSAGCRQLLLLVCVSGYPAPVQQYNLRRLIKLKEKFRDAISLGLSDHSLSSTAAIASISLGACLVEKHFTLDRQGGGPDDSFSMEPADLAQLRAQCDDTWAAMGTGAFELQPSEQHNRQFRRSLYFVKSIQVGEVVREEHVRSVRPANGLAPKYFQQVLGKKVSRDFEAGEPVPKGL